MREGEHGSRPNVYLSDMYERLRAAAELEDRSWLGEFDAFVARTLGDRPSVYERAAREHDAAKAFGLLVFEAFGELIEEVNEGGGGVTAGGIGDGPVVPVVAGVGAVVDLVEAGGDGPSGTDGGGGPGAPAVAADSRPLVTAPNFSVLGPDGEPLIEGRR